MVEWKKLSEIVEFKKGCSLSKKDLGEGDAQVILYGELYTTYGNYIKYVTSKTTLEKAKNATPLCYDDIVLPVSSTTKEAQIGKASVIKQKQSVSLGSDAIILRNSPNANYLMYYINSTLFEKDKMDCVCGTTIMHLSPKKLANKLVPIPSLSEQKWIVEILDTFSAAIENLKQQIAERRKQYEYYREELLNLEGKDENEIKCWGEFCKISKGDGVQKVNFVKQGKGCIHYGQIYTYYGSYTYTTDKHVSKEIFDVAKKASTGDLIMTDTSENVEDICKTVAYLGKDDIAVSNHSFIIKHKQNPKFLSFSTQTRDFLNQKRQYVVGVKVSCIKQTHLAQIKIYLPSLQEQSRIVSILDTFEAAIANLEAQLKEREKQYEYYRNKLLTFE